MSRHALYPPSKHELEQMRVASSLPTISKTSKSEGAMTVSYQLSPFDSMSPQTKEYLRSSMSNSNNTAFATAIVV